LTEPAAPPSRGEIWLVAFGAARKGEIGKTRPALVLSLDELQNGSPFDLITCVPLTTHESGGTSPLVPLLPAGDGLDQPSRVLSYAPRALVRSRFLRRLGRVSPSAMGQVMRARALIEGWDE